MRDARHPEADLALPAAAKKKTLNSHTLEPLEASSIDVVDQHIQKQPGPVWACCHPDCKAKRSWKNKDNARTHIRHHLGEHKLWRCREWFVPGGTRLLRPIYNTNAFSQ